MALDTPLQRWLLFLCPVLINAQNGSVILQTRYGTLLGKRVTHPSEKQRDSYTNTVDLFLGVPYAKPPTGKFRFEDPQPVEPWHGVRNATEFGWVCPQVSIFHPDTKEQHQNEDCLLLHIYSPYKEGAPSGEKYPVMVFIHGGSYEVGGGKLYDGQQLALYGVVMVAINYRLGALGFMTSGDSHLKGNYGILDQIHALKWIRDNIDVFRGDASRVTIFGQSAGGSSVGLLMTTPSAKGLFHRAIAQSGSILAAYSYHNGKNVDFKGYIRQVADIIGCRGNSIYAIVECIKSVPVGNFIKKRYKFPLYNPIDPEFRPLVDGQLVPGQPRSLYKAGKVFRVPFMTGTVQSEFGNYFSGGVRHKPQYDEALDTYLKEKMGEKASLQDTIRYEYTDWRRTPHVWNQSRIYDRGSLLSDMHMVAPTVEIATWASTYNKGVFQYHFHLNQSYHSVELNYVFGAPFSGLFADEIMDGNETSFTHKDKQLSNIMMTMWTNFAKYGNPTPKSSKLKFTWKPFNPREKNYLHIRAHHCRMKQHLRTEKVAFWNVLIPRLKAMADMAESTKEQHYRTKMWVFLGISGLLLLGIVLLLTHMVKSKRCQNPRHSEGWIDTNSIPARV